MAAVVVKNEISYAPKFFVVREVAANDAALPTNISAGLNCAEFDEVVIQITVTGTVTVAVVEPHYWAESYDGVVNGAFIPLETPVLVTYAAGGIRKIVRVGHHVSVFLEVSGIVGVGTVRIEVAGIPVYDRVK